MSSESVTLTPIAFRINQSKRPYHYFIQRFNLTGTPLWYIVLRLGDVGVWDDAFTYGFETSEAALEAWKIWADKMEKDK